MKDKTGVFDEIQLPSRAGGHTESKVRVIGAVDKDEDKVGAVQGENRGLFGLRTQNLFWSTKNLMWARDDTPERLERIEALLAEILEVLKNPPKKGMF